MEKKFNQQPNPWGTHPSGKTQEIQKVKATQLLQKLLIFIFLLDLRSTPWEQMHVWYYKSSQKPMVRELQGLQENYYF